MFILENVCPKTLKHFIFELKNWGDIFQFAKNRINLLQDEEKSVNFSAFW